MGTFELINEVALDMNDVADKLQEIEKRDKDLSFRANRTKEYLAGFVQRKPKEIQELKQKIEGLNIPRLKDRHIAKIVDVSPKDMDSLKLLLSGEAITVKDEDLKKILDLL